MEYFFFHPDALLADFYRDQWPLETVYGKTAPASGQATTLELRSFSTWSRLELIVFSKL